jgi:hypothetical protein
MKLLGRSVDAKRLAREVRARLSARGISEDTPDAPLADEAPVEPFAFLVQGLEQNLDPVQAPPGTEATGGVRNLLRFAARQVLEELLGRQRAFNVNVRDLAAQLSAEVLRLQTRVSELESNSKSPLPRRPSTGAGKSKGQHGKTRSSKQ